MNRTVFFPVLLLLALALPARAQITKYTGTWVTDKSITVPDEHTGGVVTIDAKGSTWNIFNNEMFLDFNNRMRHDTLLLLYQACECSKALKTSSIKFPANNTVFAKCHKLVDGELGIIYMDTRFIASVKKYMVGSRAERERVFPAVLHQANSKADKSHTQPATK